MSFFSREAPFSLKDTQQAALAGPAGYQKNLTDPQAKEIAALFALMDTKRQGWVDLRTAVNICRQLGFNLDVGSLDDAVPRVSLNQLLEWCEAFLAKCAASEELQLTRMFMLMQHHEFGDGVSRTALDKLLGSSHERFMPQTMESLIDYIGELSGGAADEHLSQSFDMVSQRLHAGSDIAMSEAGFKAFMRKMRLKQQGQGQGRVQDEDEFDLFAD